MKTVSTALKTHLALPTTTMATCWLAIRRDNEQFAFTDHDQDITISGWSSPYNILHDTYLAETGITSRAVVTSDALNVDTTEVHGVLTSASITEDDLRAGFWDFARIYKFQVNWNDITMGPLIQRVGWLGEVSHGDLEWKAELRGLMQLYTRTLISLTSPMCRVKRLGDAMCKVALGGSPSYQFTHAVDSVQSNNQTFFCAALTQPGPSGGVAVTGATNANPCVITLADDSLGLTDGQVVTITEVTGMIGINGDWRVRNPTDTTFEIELDTSDTGDYPPYAGGGSVIPLGSGSGFFDYGVVTWLTGANEGIEMEVKSYTPGQVTLVLPMPFAISADSPQDTFTITAGCDRSPTTCKNRFNNLVNFRGEPFVRGRDTMIQVGRGGTSA